MTNLPFESIPSNWKMERLDRLFRVINEDAHDSDEPISAFIDGSVTLRSNRPEVTIKGSGKEIGYKHIEKNDLVISGMNAHLGGLGISDSSGKCTPIYTVLRKKVELDENFIAFYLWHSAQSGYVKSLVNAVRYNSSDFGPETVKRFIVPVPPIEEQREIAEYLIELQKPIKILEKEEKLIKEYIASLLDTSFDRFRLEGSSAVLRGLIKQDNNYVSIDNDAVYDLLGVRWYGEGAFIRESVLGTETSALKLQKVSPGSLIYNRLFAWKESFAVVGEDLQNTYASGEFPMFTCEDDLLVDFLNYFLLSPRMISLITLQSQGASSISRSRWHESELMKISIPLPKLSEQKLFVDLMNGHKSNLNSIRQRKDLHLQLIHSVTSSLVTGRITLSEIKRVAHA